MTAPRKQRRVVCTHSTKTVHLPDDVHALAKAEAKRRGESLTKLVEGLIKAEVASKRAREAGAR